MITNLSFSDKHLTHHDVQGKYYTTQQYNTIQNNVTTSSKATTFQSYFAKSFGGISLSDVTWLVNIYVIHIYKMPKDSKKIFLLPIPGSDLFSVCVGKLRTLPPGKVITIPLNCSGEWQ